MVIATSLDYNIDEQPSSVYAVNMAMSMAKLDIACLLCFKQAYIYK